MSGSREIRNCRSREKSFSMWMIPLRGHLESRQENGCRRMKSPKQRTAAKWKRSSFVSNLELEVVSSVKSVRLNSLTRKVQIGNVVEYLLRIKSLSSDTHLVDGSNSSKLIYRSPLKPIAGSALKETKQKPTQIQNQSRLSCTCAPSVGRRLLQRGGPLTIPQGTYSQVHKTLCKWNQQPYTRNMSYMGHRGFLTRHVPYFSAIFD